MVDQPAQLNLRASYYDKAIKQIAERSYKFKQALTISSTGAWKNYFFRETSTPLDGATTTGITSSDVKGLPRGAPFPQASADWTRVQSTIEKYGLEENIPWEDIISNEIDVHDRTLIKIAEGVVKKVDDTIWDGLTESRVATNIQQIDIDAGSISAKFWNVASGAIIDDLLQAKQKIAEYNYPTENLMCFVSPKDYRSMMNYLAEKGAQFPAMGNEVAQNGVQGKIAGVTIVVSNSVTASYALVVVPKRCATWKELVPLQTNVSEDKYRSETIRAVEMGVLQLTDPKAVVLIKGTQKP